MKKLFVAAVLFVITVSANASGWLHDYDDALVQAKKTHQPMIVMFSEKT
jgi:hypothetical protein